MAEDTLSLRQAADELGVHYMTAYRYVRLGLLPAHKEGSHWRVVPDDLARLRERSVRSGGTKAAGGTDWKGRLLSRLLAGDEAGAWQVVESCLTAGRPAAWVYEEMVTPAMHAIGDRWQSGDVSIAEEHRATAIATRIIGRLGPHFARRGRTKGTCIFATLPGEYHSLATAIVADLVRERGYDVVDLGANVPVESLVALGRSMERLSCVAISVTNPRPTRSMRADLTMIREQLDRPVILGGLAVESEEAARQAGADAYAPDAETLCSILEGLDE